MGKILFMGVEALGEYMVEDGARRKSAIAGFKSRV